MTCFYMFHVFQNFQEITILPTKVDPQVIATTCAFFATAQCGSQLRTLRWVGNRQSLAGPRGSKPDFDKEITQGGAPQL